jgi:hypothetical protein
LIVSNDDPIVEEVRRAGEEYFKQFNFDLHAVCEDLRRRSEERGRKTVCLPPRRVSKSEAAKKAG